MEFGEIPRCSLSYPIREVKGYFLDCFCPQFSFSFLFSSCFLLFLDLCGRQWARLWWDKKEKQKKLREKGLWKPFFNYLFGSCSFLFSPTGVIPVFHLRGVIVCKKTILTIHDPLSSAVEPFFFFFFNNFPLFHLFPFFLRLTRVRCSTRRRLQRRCFPIPRKVCECVA